MNPSEFLCSLESVLRSRRVRFERAAAIAFIEACWHLIEEEPCPWTWADRFCEAAAVEVPA
jgi:hypothetical protein